MQHFHINIRNNIRSAVLSLLLLLILLVQPRVHATANYQLPQSGSIEAPSGEPNYILLTNNPDLLPKEYKPPNQVYTPTTFPQGLEGYEELDVGTQVEIEVAISKNSTIALELQMQLVFDILNREDIENMTSGETLLGIQYPIIYVEPGQTEIIRLEVNDHGTSTINFFVGNLPDREGYNYTGTGSPPPNSTAYIKSIVTMLFQPENKVLKYLLYGVLILIAVFVSRKVMEKIPMSQEKQ